MSYSKNKGSRVKQLFSNYLNTTYKKIEYPVCITMYVLLLMLQLSTLVPTQAKGIPAQIHLFIAIYMAIRFSYLGFGTIALLNLFEITNLSRLYSASHDMGQLIGLILKVIVIISTHIVAILSNRQEKQKKQLRTMAITDELTAVYNRRYFGSILDKEIESAEKNKTTVGLILIDIDNFKMFNDLFGHNYGDSILKGTADLLNDTIKDSGLVFRYGGDEFAVLLPGMGVEAIESTAYRIKERLHALKGNYYPSHFNHQITLSMGLSEYPNMSGNKDELISQADMALYHAKNLGKDKVHFYQDVFMQLRKSIRSDHQQLIGIFKGLLSSISAKDQYTLRHSERVSNYAVMVGERLRLSPKDISDLQYAGLLHDIGKIEIAKSVLNKAERLTDEEFELLHMHPIYSANILEPLEDMEQLIDYVKHHHERMDGRGYPDKLTGKEISLGARILCVADSFDAMLSERPYGKVMSMEEAFCELARCAGTQFDPEIVNVFVAAMREKPA